MTNLLSTTAKAEAEIVELKFTNARLKEVNSRLLNQQGGFVTKIKRLENEVLALKTTYALPTLNPDEARLYELFPRLPFIQKRLREVFMILWTHRESSLANDPADHPYLPASVIHLRVYSYSTNPPLPGVVSVFLHHLQKELKGTRLQIEKKPHRGWRLKLGDVETQPAVAENKS